MWLNNIHVTNIDRDNKSEWLNLLDQDNGWLPSTQLGILTK